MNTPAVPRSRRGTDPSVTVAKNVNNTGSSYEELTQLYEGLRQRRLRHEVGKEAAERALASCIEEAQKTFGVNTLDELRALVDQKKAEEQAALSQFAADLESEKALLDGIEADLRQEGVA